MEYKEGASKANCLVYLPHSYSGRGPAESCVQIIRHFSPLGLETTLKVARKRRPVPASIETDPALPGVLNWVPWRFVSDLGMDRLDAGFRKSLSEMEPGVAYFWPTASPELVEYAKARSWIAVREMTNRTLEAAKATLDHAFALAGEDRPHHISQERVEDELGALRQYDFIFSSNEDVDISLRDAGIPEERILRTTFGWAEERFGSRRHRDTGDDEFVVGYLGTISIGKGICDLLAGWKEWNGRGRLKLAGPIDWSMADAVKSAAGADDRIEVVGYVEDIEGFYRDCDVIVIPTLDEGGPQVTYEAAAAGAALIATPMARARMLEDGRNALIVPTHDGGAIAKALDRLSGDPDLRGMLGDNAQRDVMPFAYLQVGEQRAAQLLAIVHDKRVAKEAAV